MRGKEELKYSGASMPMGTNSVVSSMALIVPSMRRFSGCLPFGILLGMLGDI